MKTSYKLLVEQAWALRESLIRYIEIYCKKGIAKRRSERQSTAAKQEALELAVAHAYSRYLRRLKKLWEMQKNRVHSSSGLTTQSR